MFKFHLIYRVSDALKSLRKYKAENLVNIAAVATGFPSGQYSLKTRLKEIHWAVESGASEIDIVINRALALKHDWDGLYQVMATGGGRLVSLAGPGFGKVSLKGFV